jgi:beta-N-acetylhexosaminidase
MKRLLVAVLAALSLSSLVGCGGLAQEEPAAVEETPKSSQAEPTALDEPDPEPTPEELAAQALEDLLSSLSLEEKVGQLFFVRCPAENAVSDVETYHLGGYILFGRDFQDGAGNWLTEEEFTDTVQSYQDAASIPLLVGVDEEGGTVARASRNPNLFSKKCLSPQALWKEQQSDDSHDVFAADAWEKNSALLRYGINVNLAPVCDVSTDPGSFIYDRTLGQGSEETSEYVTSVVTAMRECGIGSVLKHFPGYGDNEDTHSGIAVDERPYEIFENSDLLPFQAGIAAGGGSTAVLVSHNIVTCMDADLPASLSPAVHEVLRENFGFDGVVMTDDLAMDAVAAYAQDGAVAVMALETGNDLIITTDYRAQIPKVLEAVENETLDEETIDTACRRVLAWKQVLGLI